MTAPFRVLYVNHVGILGGAEKSLLRLLECLDRRQIEPHLAAPEGPLAEAVRQIGIPVHTLPTCRLRRPRYPWDYLSAFRTFQAFTRSLRKVCRLLQPDLIHANSLIGAWAATRVARAPIIWHCRDLQSSPPIMQAIRPKVARVIAISQAVADYLDEASARGRSRMSRPTPITVIYNGFGPADVHVSRRRSQVRADWEMGADTPLIGCMGQLVPWKRQDVLLRAMSRVLAEVPQARLIVMGDDSFGEQPAYVVALHELAETLGIESHVVWAGQVEHPADALAALDILAHPAEREPFGRVVLEALALGVPVAAISQAGPAEIIEDGRSGLLVPPNDPEAMAQAIVRVLQDDELKKNLSDGARIRASHFSAAAMAEQVLDLYREVLGR